MSTSVTVTHIILLSEKFLLIKMFLQPQNKYLQCFPGFTQNSKNSEFIHKSLV